MSQLPFDAPPARSRGRGYFLGGLMAGVIVVAAGWWLTHRVAMTVLTAETLAAAQAKWQAHAPASYDLDLRVMGARSGQVHVEVRNQVVTQMTRDGKQPSRRDTWDVWSVPGMFDTITTEWNERNEVGRFAGSDAPSRPGETLYQAARFDDTYGYPSLYYRSVPGTPISIGWQVDRMTPITTTSAE